MVFSIGYEKNVLKLIAEMWEHGDIATTTSDNKISTSQQFSRIMFQAKLKVRVI